MLANQAFQARAGRIGLDWSSGVSTHCLQWVEYNPGWTPQVPRCKKAKPLPELSKEAPSADEVFAGIWRGYQRKCNEAGEDLDQMREVIEEVAT
eukprot:14456108-Heterocapsa_arctica.AAC.1